MTIPFRAKQKESTTLPKQSTPRKGTETTNSTFQFCSRLETIYTPQGDGNPFLYRVSIKSPKKQSTPRKGTETYCFAHILPKLIETIYTPQGDGNRSAKFKLFRFSRNNLHPARGRKLACGSSHCSCHCKKQSTPRKGTEIRSGTRYSRRQ